MLIKAYFFTNLKVLRNSCINTVAYFIPLLFGRKLFSIEDYADDPWGFDFIFRDLLSWCSYITLLRISIIKNAGRKNKIFYMPFWKFEGYNS